MPSCQAAGHQGTAGHCVEMLCSSLAYVVSGRQIQVWLQSDRTGFAEDFGSGTYALSAKAWSILDSKTIVNSSMLVVSVTGHGDIFKIFVQSFTSECLLMLGSIFV